MKRQTVDDKTNEISDWVMEEISTHLNGCQAWTTSEASEICESPIEEIFYTAFASLMLVREMTGGGLFGAHCGMVLPHFGKTDGLIYEYPRDAWAIQTDLPDEITHLFVQAKVGTYRADFIVCRVIRPYLDKSKVLESPPVVIECDGHDFHERTKEQAQRDKERDRWFQSEGFIVLRFTGSEIWKDGLGCAKQVSELLDRRLTELLDIRRAKGE